MKIQRDHDDLELLSFLSDVVDEEGEKSTLFMWDKCRDLDEIYY